METTFKKILPADVFISVLKHDKSDNKWFPAPIVNTTGNLPSGNEFIDLFASLIRKHQKKYLSFYAKQMGVSATKLSQYINTMSDITAQEWLNGYLNLEACELLEKTNKKINEIAGFLGFSQSAFSQFFLRQNKCSPYEWRNLKKYGKKYSYHCR